ncbi:AAA family ATPase [Salimicrobium halophilum]|uniref:Stage V sporulation protein K n=1 Tax=Salimicrobium halophilum TaxID=86666 RepID=A0A1G8Q6E1_9BACI|nr:AAA family ATPase [Salimicrobium halophilum]SDJ00297.1 stage V sporulation protein K [Salimicrobium halophilum]
MVSVRNTNGSINVTLNRKTAISYVEKPTFPSIDQRFRSIIGLNKVKEELKEIYAQELVAKKRRLKGLKSQAQSKHMIFEGNPGTGKTTVARLLGEIMRETDILSKGHLVEVDRSRLVGEYVGQTAKKTREKIEEAVDGVLFIDEAYALARGGDNDFGKEAVDTLVKGMEDYRDRLVIILAGYPREMRMFMKMNPGLSSRFPYYLIFEDYSSEELFSIIVQMLKERDYYLSKGASVVIKELLEEGNADRANARYSRNLVEEIVRKQSLRMIAYDYTDKEHLMTIEKDDVLACMKEEAAFGKRKSTYISHGRPFS